MGTAEAQQSLFNPPRTRSGRYLVLSGVVHALLIAVALLWSRFFLPPALDLSQKPIHASLIRLGKPREKQLLPEKEEPPPPPPKAVEAAPAPTPAPPKPTVPVPGVKPTEAHPVKVSGAKQGDDHRRDLFNAFNKISKSTSKRELTGALNGDARGDSSVDEGDRYFGLLKAQVQQAYNLPNTLSDDERIRLKALVHIYIGGRGQLLKVKRESSSGNELFDNAVLSAARQAAPYPPPPEPLREKLQNQGVVLAFTPNGS